MTNAREISVEYLARVEGEGSMRVKVVDDKIEDVEFSIFEPPRFFEAFLRGRPHTEAPDITARICGICPVAYQMSAVHAMEDAFDVPVGGSLRELRRLLYCGEWIESHALHIYLLHAPDFLGYESGIHMAADHREVVEQGLRLWDTVSVDGLFFKIWRYSQDDEKSAPLVMGYSLELIPVPPRRFHLVIAALLVLLIGAAFVLVLVGRIRARSATPSDWQKMVDDDSRRELEDLDRQLNP